MPGYSLAAVDQSRIDEKSLCPKCKGLLKEAVQTIQCGHRYCKTCVDTLLKWVNTIMQESVKWKKYISLDNQLKHASRKKFGYTRPFPVCVCVFFLFFVKTASTNKVTP